MEAISLGLNSKIIERHEKKQKEMAEKLKDSFENIKKDIEKNTKNKEEEFFTFVASNLNFPGNKAENIRMRQQLIRDLQADPNIISRTETEIDGHKLAAKMQPYAFKWVMKSEKAGMRFRANTIKGITEKQLSFIEQKVKRYESGTETDILRCFEYLTRIGADKKWIPLDVFEVARKCSIPIEECTKAIDALVRNDAAVIAKYKIERANRHGTSSEKTKLAISIRYDDEAIERLMTDAEDGDYVAQKIEESQAERKKNVVPATTVRDLTDKLDIDVSMSKRKEVLNKVKDRMGDINTVNSIRLLGTVEESLETTPQPPAEEARTNGVDNLEEFATMISGELVKKFAGFLNGRISAVQEERDNALFEKNNAIIFKEKQAQHIEMLQGKISQLEDKLASTQKKLARTEEKLKAYENFSEDFSVNAIEQFRMMKRLILKAAIQYSELPNYKKWDENKKAEFTDSVDEAIRKTSDKIVNFTPESKMPPNQE